MTQAENHQPAFRISEMPPYVLGELAEEILAARKAGREILDLSQMNPNLGAPSAAVEKLVQAALLEHQHRYSSSQGIFKLRKAFADWYEQRYSVPLDPEEEVVVTLGSKEGIAHLLLSLFHSGDNILLPTPTYPIHSAAAFIAGANALRVPLHDWETSGESLVLSGESDFFFRGLESSIQRTWPRPRAILLSFPHNPSTSVVEASFWNRLFELAKENEMYVIHDFAYSTLSFDGEAPSCLEADAKKERSVEFFSLSKGFNVPGWRIGFCVGNREVIAALKRMKSYVDSGVFQPIQIAALELLAQAEEISEEIREIYRARRDVLIGGLRDIDWKPYHAAGTVFVWCPIPEKLAELKSVEAARHVLRETGVALCPGLGFGESSDGFLRFALSEDESRLRRVIEELRRL